MWRQSEGGLSEHWNEEYRAEVSKESEKASNTERQEGEFLPRMYIDNGSPFPTGVDRATQDHRYSNDESTEGNQTHDAGGPSIADTGD